MEQIDTERLEGPMSDGEYIRKTDKKPFDQEKDNGLHGSCLISEMLQREYISDFKLQPASVAKDNVPRCEFPFNRHTVTIGVGNVVVDFDTARKEHEQILETQRIFAEKIESLKEEMEKVRIIEKAWYDDYLNKKYANDLTAQLRNNRSRGIGDACATVQESYIGKLEKQKDEHGTLHVRSVKDNDTKPSFGTVRARGIYIVPYDDSVARLPKVSL